MHADFREQFRAAMLARGVTPPDHVEADGALHRFGTNGKRHDDAGWYVLHGDGIPAGAFGDFRADVAESWRAEVDRVLTSEEEAAHRLRIESMRRAREAEQIQRQSETADRLRELWASAPPASADHPYLVRKRIPPSGIRQRGDELLVPVRDESGTLISLQTISPEGEKRFHPGGRVRGGYYAMGTPEGVLLICEGFATGASLHEATGHAVAVAFSIGNLELVARRLKDKFPHASIVICADDDTDTPGNPGVTRALEAGKAIGAVVAVPEFGDERSVGLTDFNDMSTRRGRDAVRVLIENTRRSAAWPEPEELPSGVPAVRSIDDSMLPMSLRPWILDVCERLQCPLDFVAVPAIVALGSLIGRKVAIRPQACTDWTAYPNVWGCIVGRPGTMKSPAVSEALRPLRRLEARARQTHDECMQAFRAASELAKLKQEAAKSEARKRLASKKGAEVRAEDLRVDAPDEPVLRRYTANDSSLEALGELLRQNPNGLLIERDELASLLTHLSREENASARGFFLSGADATTPYTFDRIGRGLNLQVPAVALSVLGTTQPGRIATYLRQALVGGNNDDGLMQRFGLMVWPDHSAEWRNIDRWPDSVAREDAFATFDSLANLDVDEVGAEAEGEIAFLRFSPDALAIFTRWRAELEAKVRSGDLHPALESHLSKYRKTIPALALIFHLVDGGRGSVAVEATLRALQWAEYLETHALRCYGAMRANEADAARKIVDKLRRGDLTDGFRSRTITQRDWSGLTDTHVVTAALTMLVDRGWLAEMRTDNSMPGRPTVVYRVNPRALTR